MSHKLKEKLSIFIAKHPGRTVLLAILAFNISFFLFAATLISGLSLSVTEQMNFLEAAFCTITMILDAGCISLVIRYRSVGHCADGGLPDNHHRSAWNYLKEDVRY